MDEFRRRILKLNQSRTHRVTNSYGVYDIYKYIRKNKWFDIGKIITEHQFYTIIRTINNHIAEQLSEGKDITLPCRMGKLELRKRNTTKKFIEGKLVTNLPVDWNNTIKLWSEDEEAYQNRTLLKREEKELFKVYYNKTRANYKNKAFYKFNLNREIKKKLKYNIKERGLDAFMLR